jgi:hypothetical protein
MSRVAPIDHKKLDEYLDEGNFEITGETILNANILSSGGGTIPFELCKESLIMDGRCDAAVANRVAAAASEVITSLYNFGRTPAGESFISFAGEQWQNWTDVAALIGAPDPFSVDDGPSTAQIVVANRLLEDPMKQRVRAILVRPGFFVRLVDLAYAQVEKLKNEFPDVEFLTRQEIETGVKFFQLLYAEDGGYLNCALDPNFNDHISIARPLNPMLTDSRISDAHILKLPTYAQKWKIGSSDGAAFLAFCNNIFEGNLLNLGLRVFIADSSKVKLNSFKDRSLAQITATPTDTADRIVIKLLWTSGNLGDGVACVKFSVEEFNFPEGKMPQKTNWSVGAIDPDGKEQTYCGPDEEILKRELRKMEVACCRPFKAVTVVPV